MALSELSVLFKYNGTAYPVNLDGNQPNHSQNLQPDVPSLLDICCIKIVKDATMTEQALASAPVELWYSLMTAALNGARDRAIEVLISHWPWDTLSLHKFTPYLFDSVRVIYDESYLNQRIKKGIQYTSNLVHAFIDCLRRRTPTKLKCLDLSGYPAAEVIVNYISSHVLLVFNELRQKEIISAYNAVTKNLPADQRRTFHVDLTLPDESYIVTMDAFLQTSHTHMELCKALFTSSNPQCRFKLRLKKLDMVCLSFPRITVLLEQIDPDHLTSLTLQYNGMCNDALTMLVPSIQRLKQLESLDISCNNINLVSADAGRATQSMADILSSLPKLHRLCLSNNRTKSKLSYILSDIPSQLEYIKLCGCGLSKSDLIYLRNSHHAKSLRELDISGNSLQGVFQEVLKLLYALRSTLCVLELEECQLDTQCMGELFQFIPCLSGLQFLNLCRNRQWTCELVSDALMSLVQLPVLQAVRFPYPECYPVESVDNNDVNLREYMHAISNEAEQLCQRLGRSQLRILPPT